MHNPVTFIVNIDVYKYPVLQFVFSHSSHIHLVFLFVFCQAEFQTEREKKTNEGKLRFLRQVNF